MIFIFVFWSLVFTYLTFNIFSVAVDHDSSCTSSALLIDLSNVDSDLSFWVSVTAVPSTLTISSLSTIGLSPACSCVTLTFKSSVVVVIVSVLQTSFSLNVSLPVSVILVTSSHVQTLFFTILFWGVTCQTSRVSFPPPSKTVVQSVMGTIDISPLASVSLYISLVELLGTVDLIFFVATYAFTSTLFCIFSASLLSFTCRNSFMFNLFPVATLCNKGFTVFFKYCMAL